MAELRRLLSDCAVIEYMPPVDGKPEVFRWIGADDALIAATDEFLEDVDPEIWARIPWKLEKVDRDIASRITFFRRVR